MYIYIYINCRIRKLKEILNSTYEVPCPVVVSVSVLSCADEAMVF